MMIVLHGTPIHTITIFVDLRCIRKMFRIRLMIDRMMRRAPGTGRCELCEKEIATRKAKFKAQYVETTSSPLMDEETMSSVDVESVFVRDA